jgi:type 1 glutamine amidotransferase
MHRALVYTRTTQYRHDSIPAGVAAIEELGRDVGLAVGATQEPGAFTPEGLADYRVVVFLSTSGDVLTEEGRAAFGAWVRDGGGFVGVHLAAGTEPSWGFFGDLIGARFTRHPDLQPAVLTIEDQRHPATAHLPAQWPFSDEWYEFAPNPRGSVRVLASVDERGYEGGRMGAGPSAGLVPRELRRQIVLHLARPRRRRLRRPALPLAPGGRAAVGGPP